MVAALDALVAAGRRSSAMAGLGPLVAAGPDEPLDPPRSRRPQLRFNSIDTGVGGYHLAQLAIGVLGVLVITGEYSTGHDPLELHGRAAAPAGAVGQGGVFAAVTFVLMLISALVAFFVVAGDRRPSHHVQHSLGDPHALRAVIGAALFLTVLGRSRDRPRRARPQHRRRRSRCSSFLLFVLPGHHRDPAGQHRATRSARTCRSTRAPRSPRARSTTAAHLGTWGGFALFCGYAALALGAGRGRLMRRDA